MKMPHDDKFIGGKNGEVYICVILLCAVLAKQGEWMSCGSWVVKLSHKVIAVKIVLH